MIRYKSKIGIELIIPITIIIGGVGIIMLYEKIWLGVVLILSIFAFILYICFTTYYDISNTILKIQCGFLYNETILIDTIKEIKETNSPLSSPAISLDRIEISYNKYDVVIISPKEKSDFIKQLTKINPTINVTLKQSQRVTYK